VAAHPVNGEPFDIPYWQGRIREAQQVVAAEYPAGCLDWLKETEPETIQELRARVDVLKQAFLRQNVKWLSRELVSYQSAHFTVFERHRAKMERQQLKADLLGNLATLSTLPAQCAMEHRDQYQPA